MVDMHIYASKEEKKTIERGAKLANAESVSRFVIDQAVAKAQRLIKAKAGGH